MARAAKTYVKKLVRLNLQGKAQRHFKVDPVVPGENIKVQNDLTRSCYKSF